MTKSELIGKLAERMSLSQQSAETIVHTVFESMEAALRRGDRIEIRGLGTFEVRSYEGYEGRNPKTGVRVSVRPKRVPFFKAGKEIKERINRVKEEHTPNRKAIPSEHVAPFASPV